MTQVDDLNRSLAVFDQNTSLIVVVELSEASWLVAGLIPGVARQPLKKLAPDPDALLRLLERWKAEAVKAGQTLGMEEMRAIVERLETTSRPRTCPHGRPTMILLSTSALERQFGRR